MILMIKHHVLVFGAKFITAEFAGTALVGVSLAIFFGISRQIGFAIASVGITLNCLVMLAYGIHAMTGKQEKSYLQSKDKQTLIETLTLSMAIIVPFILFMLICYELIIFHD